MIDGRNADLHRPWLHQHLCGNLASEVVGAANNRGTIFSLAP